MEKEELVLPQRPPKLRLILEERVETALRYLDPAEQDNVSKFLEVLKAPNQSPEFIAKKHARLGTGQDSPEMFLFRVSPRLRAIFWYPGDGSVVVEDLASHEVLSHHFQGIAG